MNNNITPYQSDILAQPQAMQDTLDYLNHIQKPDAICEEFHRGKWSKVVLTGMGSSYHALYPLYLRLIQAGKPAWLVETSELIHYQQAFLQEEVLITPLRVRCKRRVPYSVESRPKNRTMLGITNSNKARCMVSVSILTRREGKRSHARPSLTPPQLPDCWRLPFG